MQKSRSYDSLFVKSRLEIVHTKSKCNMKVCEGLLHFIVWNIPCCWLYQRVFRHQASTYQAI